MVMADRQLFLQLMSAASATTSQKEAYLYNGLLDQWWGKVFHFQLPLLIRRLPRFCSSTT